MVLTYQLFSPLAPSQFGRFVMEITTMVVPIEETSQLLVPLVVIMMDSVHVWGSLDQYL
jgi:hypothetical protein